MLNEFIEELLQQKQLPASLDPTVKQRLVQDLTTRLNDLINRRLLDAMDDKTLAEFNKMIEKEAEATELQEFIDKNVPDKQQIVTAALLEFRQLYLGDGQGVTKES
ncbi:MAG TPA: DUF5663 domain-containing protein [Candidatus Babeliales bacterium]|nr:DUF5663 domain-containing protein [Candidatus Babeliales bacterium]